LEGEDQGAAWYMFILLLELNSEITKITKRTNKTETVLSGADTKTENNYPQNTGGKRLSKYGSQSETTIDSCL
jgi:hypothetical protein